MYYVANVPMSDQRGNIVNGVGVISNDGNYIATCIARKGSWTWKPSSSGTSMNRTIGFADIEVKGFKPTTDPDDKGFVEGSVGDTIINSTPVYVMQSKDGQGIVGEPFVRSLKDYRYKASDRSNQTYNFIQLLPENLQKMIDEAINKASEILDEDDAAGKVHQQSNESLSRTASAFTKVADRDESRKGNTSKEITKPEVEQQTMNDLPV